MDFLETKQTNWIRVQQHLLLKHACIYLPTVGVCFRHILLRLARAVFAQQDGLARGELHGAVGGPHHRGLTARVGAVLPALLQHLKAVARHHVPHLFVAQLQMWWEGGSGELPKLQLATLLIARKGDSPPRTGRSAHRCRAPPLRPARWPSGTAGGPC